MPKLLKLTQHLSPCSATRAATAMRSPRTAAESSTHSLQLKKAITQQCRPGTAKKRKSLSHVLSHSLQPQGLSPAGLLCPWNSPCQSTGVGSTQFPLPGDLPNPGFRTQVSRIAGRFLTIGATKLKILLIKKSIKLTLKKKEEERPEHGHFSLSQVRIQEEDSHQQTRILPGTWSSASTLILDFLAAGQRETHVCCLRYSVYRILLQQPSVTKRPAY